jgi:hypothetical protein
VPRAFLGDTFGQVSYGCFLIEPEELTWSFILMRRVPRKGVDGEAEDAGRRPDRETEGVAGRELD